MCLTCRRFRTKRWLAAEGCCDGCTGVVQRQRGLHHDRWHGSVTVAGMNVLDVTISDQAATLSHFEGLRATLLSPAAAAPGARLFCVLTEGRLPLAGDRVLKVKVHRCVKVEGGFRIDGKAFDLRRPLRLALQQYFAPPSA